MKKLGVIGGLGSKATAYFFKRLVDLTDAATDQDHLEVMIHNHPQIPDRTAYILGESNDNPKPYLLNDTKQLIEFGCDAIYVPCNTAHYFIDQFDSDLKSKFIHMIDETVNTVVKRGMKKVLLLATTGTIQTKLYQDAFAVKGIDCDILTPILQDQLMDIIYSQIKAGKDVTSTDVEVFVEYANTRHVDAVILGCTELSLLKEMLDLPDFYIDAMDCAIKACLLKAGKCVKTL